MIISLHVADVGARAVATLLRERLHPRDVPGLRSAQTTLTGAIAAGPPRLHPGRVALLASWEDDAALDGFLERNALAERLAGGWHVRLRPIRMSGSWSAMPVEIDADTAATDDDALEHSDQECGEREGGKGDGGKREGGKRAYDDQVHREQGAASGPSRGQERGERQIGMAANPAASAATTPVTLPLAPPDATPVAVLTLGQLRLRRALPFLRANSRAAGRAAADPALLASLALARPPRFVSTFSIWQSVDAMRRYAYGSAQPDHKAAIQAHQTAPFHHEAGFIRCLPYAAQGTLDGRDPLATTGTPTAGTATAGTATAAAANTRHR
ncbi:spheroidene monooxygenase [Streptomyces sp. NPDC059649]|uniref:spheroidene monooxygenase n=1 Tax=Streptomyces sp. NPDC059649 TaxID=3346895 RepID=UPI0036805005